MTGKSAILLMSLICVFSLGACGSNQQSGTAAESENSGTAAESESSGTAAESESSVTAAASESSVTEDGKALVVYYSATGNTEEAAVLIADAADADVFKLEPVKVYSSGDLDWTDDNSRVVYEHDHPDDRDVELVADTVSDWEAYDTVFVGYPIWWGIAAWPMNGFVKANDFSGKTVVPFCTSSSSGLGESGKLLEDIAGTGNWLEGIRFSSGVTEETVQEWMDTLGL